MNESPKNRRLQIMPEVLPAPTRIQAPSNVRGRTMAHMQRLLATASIPLVASCTKEDSQGTQTVTIPTANATSSTTSQDQQATIDASLLPPPTATATATATVPNSTGYAVVDPMPAPARCMGLSAASKSSATFKRVGANIVLEISITLPSSGQWTGSVFTTNPPSPWSSSLVSSSLVNQHATVVLKPSQQTVSAGVQLGISCAAGTGSISVQLTYADPPTAGAPVAIHLYDY